MAPNHDSSAQTSLGRAQRACGPAIRCRDGLEHAERFPLVVEASGSPDGLTAAMDAVEPEGTIVLKSTYAGRPPADLSLGIVVPEVTLVGSRCGPFADALELLGRGAIATEPLIDGAYDLERWEEAFAAAARPAALKVLLRP